jgi:hypothetical protein
MREGGFIHALRTVRRQPVAVVIPVVADFIALIVFAAFYSSLFVAASEHIQAINDILGSETAAIVGGSGAVAQQETLYPHLTALMMNIGVILLFMYVLWTLSQAVGWWLAHEATSGRAWSWRRAASDVGFTLFRMLWLNLVWGAVFAVILVGSGLLMGQALTTPVPILGPGFFVTVTIVLLVVLLYLMVMSYAFITHKRPLRTALGAAVRKLWRFGTLFCVVMVVMAALTALVPVVGQIQYLLGVLLFLIILCWAAVGRAWMCGLVVGKEAA